MHTWHYVKHVVSNFGTPLALDAATFGKTRPIMAKIRVEIDLTKPLPDSVWVGSEDEKSPLKGYTQKIEYENIPKYCKHCRKLGHNMINCRVLEKKRIAETTMVNDNEMKETQLQAGEGSSRSKEDVRNDNDKQEILIFESTGVEEKNTTKSNKNEKIINHEPKDNAKEPG